MEGATKNDFGGQRTKFTTAVQWKKMTAAPTPSQSGRHTPAGPEGNEDCICGGPKCRQV